MPTAKIEIGKPDQEALFWTADLRPARRLPSEGC
jgi:hypothetical protein